MAVFWDVASRSLTESDISEALTASTVRVTTVYIYRTTRCYIPEDILKDVPWGPEISPSYKLTEWKVSTLERCGTTCKPAEALSEGERRAGYNFICCSEARCVTNNIPPTSSVYRINKTLNFTCEYILGNYDIILKQNREEISILVMSHLQRVPALWWHLSVCSVARRGLTTDWSPIQRMSDELNEKEAAMS